MVIARSAHSRFSKGIEGQVIRLSGARDEVALEFERSLAEQGARVLVFDGSQERERTFSSYEKTDVWVHFLGEGGLGTHRSIYSANASLIQAEAEDEEEEFENCFGSARSALRQGLESMRERGGLLLLVDTYESEFPVGMHSVCSKAVETYFQAFSGEARSIGLPIAFHRIAGPAARSVDAIIQCLRGEAKDGAFTQDQAQPSVYSKISDHPWLTLATVGAGVAGVVIAKTIRASASMVGAGGKSVKEPSPIKKGVSDRRTQGEARQVEGSLLRH